jgi:ribonuclease PH
VAAISAGLYGGIAVVDLDYAEDSKADADANFVLTAGGGIVEVQATAESEPFRQEQLDALLGLSRNATKTLFDLQQKALEDAASA